ncbi:MAG: HEAT repeat domain-containing protein [Verrucomicrobiota bacterium]
MAQRQLATGSPQKRLEAVQKLRALEDPDGVPFLVEALKDAEVAVRIEVTWALGDFKQPDAVKALIGALRDHAEAVQEAAAQALKKNGNAAAIEALVGTLLRGTPGVQYHTAQTLHALNWLPRTPGEQISFYVARGDFKRVSMFGSAAIPALAAVLRGGSGERRVAAANTLAELGESSVVKLLLSALRDSEAAVRAAAVNGLARMGDPQAVTGLLPLLKDRDRNVRVATVSALGQMADTGAIRPLTELVEDREWEVRAVLAEALGRFEDRSALPAVLKLVKDRDQEVRQNAVDALGRVGDETTLDNLVLAMVDEHMGVRQAAARAATTLDPYWQRSPRIQALVPELQAALRHGDSGVQVAAAGLLRRLTGRSATELLSSSPKRVGTLAGDSMTEFFQRLLLDADEDVRLAAAEALGRERSPATIPALQTALSDKSKWVRRAAEQGITAALASA